MWLHYGARNLALFTGEHQISHITWIISFKLIFKTLAVDIRSWRPKLFSMLLQWRLLFLCDGPIIALLRAVVDVLKTVFVGIWVIIIVVLVVAIFHVISFDQVPVN